MSFYVLDENPVRSADKMCWLDCESAAFDGARIIVSAVKEHGFEIDDLPFEGKDNHPLVKWAVVSRENARWLYRNTRAACIKWGKESEEEGYAELMAKLNEVAGIIDTRLPAGNQQTLFGNFYVDGETIPTFWSEDTIESTNAFYQQTKKHLMWIDGNTLKEENKNE